MIWQECIKAQDRNKDLKVSKGLGIGPKGSLVMCGFTTKLINLKNSKDISAKELMFQLSNVMKICAEF